MKLCTVCNQQKLNSDFNKNSKKKDGLQGKCRDCQKKYYKKYYDDNIEERQRILSKNLIQKEQRREILNKAKDTECYDCGVKYPPYVMDFDHLGDKSFTISSKFTSVSLNNLIKEINKCDVVCSNCHRTRTHKRRQSPLV